MCVSLFYIELLTQERPAGRQVGGQVPLVPEPVAPRGGSHATQGASRRGTCLREVVEPGARLLSLQATSVLP